MTDLNLNFNIKIMKVYLLELSHLLDLTLDNIKVRLSIFFIKDNSSKLC